VKSDKLAFEVYEDKGKEYRWRLKTKSGDNIASSPKGYETRAECEKAVESIKKNAPSDRIEESASPSTLTFEVYADAAKEFRWRLKNADGANLATGGEGYKDKADCRKAVDRVKADVKSDKLAFEVYEDKAKEHRWRLTAKNGEIVASSPTGYKSKAECDKAVELIRSGVAAAKVEDKP
jgi:uncharacterized protein YegP (UPF0339 family)